MWLENYTFLRKFLLLKNKKKHIYLFAVDILIIPFLMLCFFLECQKPLCRFSLADLSIYMAKAIKVQVF